MALRKVKEVGIDKKQEQWEHDIKHKQISRKGQSCEGPVNFEVYSKKYHKSSMIGLCRMYWGNFKAGGGSKEKSIASPTKKILRLMLLRGCQINIARQNEYSFWLCWLETDKKKSKYLAVMIHYTSATTRKIMLLWRTNYRRFIQVPVLFHTFSWYYGFCHIAYLFKEILKSI